MNKKLFLILSIVCIIAGAVLGHFAGYQQLQLTGFALTMFGAGLAVANLWENKKEGANKITVILSMALVGIGAFVAGMTKVITDEQVGQIIGYVFALILIISGIVTAALANKDTKKLN